ncbi:ribose 5-phosphate isomerase B [Erwiniaceae bacterium BAC15a-03b]|uniref:Ribose 5-phosphate isomerase B n=1 Tax=Winslowiella arboricola TaxID=2978220 RepID=A0A9J6PQV1_9GAMM|nr:ribose 5-phosphate isomerase B [Winslowiella arboricola]MCU5773224.1 ribose 5-phosphate isomerase B [Winslowiella arboricola]MCU5779110.1 ribose 5-phosphate isomerase B [Winslowiella arboricola]
MLPVAIGSDDAATELKDTLMVFLRNKGVEVKDYSDTAELYPDIAVHLAQQIINGTHQRGILLCGTGIGMSISANKVPGIRAALCHDNYSAERARKSNDAQIITLGARVIGPELAKSILSAWLASEFEAGASAAKVARIQYYDHQFHQPAAGADNEKT